MSEPIRILHVIGIMNRGGAEAMIMNLYRNIDRNRVQFDFVENTFEPAAYDEEILSLGGRIYRCPHYNGKNHITYKKWWKKFFDEHAEEYTAVHGHLGSTAAIYLKEAKKKGIYAIAHSHNSGTDHSLKSFLYGIMSYNTRNIADYFFACSKVAGTDRFGKKVGESDRCMVLNNAIDTSKFDYNEAVRREVREELGLGEEVLAVGHIGRFATQKNHSFLIDIFAKVAEERPDAVLLLVGDGELRKQIEDKVSRLKLQGQVKFLGVRTDVERIVQAMDVLVFPSLFEGLPVTLVETQTSGLPAVISDKVPEESILIPSIMKMLSLETAVEEWRKAVLELGEIRRVSGKDEIRKSGYDIKQTVTWLTDYYSSIEVR